MRDRYRGPVSRKNSRTSESTRNEIGIFAAGKTGTASSQKSGGSSRSSSGEDRRISASVMRRSCARFARPGLGLELGWENFAVRLTLTMIAHSGRNDSSDDFASLSPVGIDHCERDAIGQCRGRSVIPHRNPGACRCAPQSGRRKISVANAKSNPRSLRFRSLFSGSQSKRTHAIYACIYVRALIYMVA